MLRTDCTTGMKREMIDLICQLAFAISLGVLTPPDSKEKREECEVEIRRDRVTGLAEHSRLHDDGWNCYTC
jgi:hypothetical protein